MIPRGLILAVVVVFCVNARGESPPDLRLAAELDEMRKEGIVISPVSYSLSKESAFGRLNEYEPREVRESGSQAIAASYLTKSYLLFHFPGGILRVRDNKGYQKGSLSKTYSDSYIALCRVADKEGYSIGRLPNNMVVLYPAYMDDPLLREVALGEFLENEGVATFELEEANLVTLKKRYTDTISLLEKINTKSAALAELEKRRGEFELLLQGEIWRGKELDAELADWIVRVSNIGNAPALTSAKDDYDPKSDSSVTVLERDPNFVKMNQDRTPFVEWKGNGVGVPTPYLDKKLEQKLAEFFENEKDALAAIGAMGIRIESAARTPLRGAKLKDSGNGWAVGSFNSNHLLGVSVDFSGIEKFNWAPSNGTLSESETRVRKANHDKLAKLLKGYGIDLGTTGRNRKPDPLHATLSEMVSPKSPERLQRLSEVVARYANHFAQQKVIETSKAKAAEKKEGAFRAGVEKIDAMVAAANKKLADIEKSLNIQKEKNKKTSDEIAANQNTYNVIKRAKGRSGMNRNEVRELSERIRRGDSDGYEKYKEMLEKMTREYGSCKGEYQDDKNYRISCETTEETGGKQPSGGGTKEPKGGGTGSSGNGGGGTNGGGRLGIRV